MKFVSDDSITGKGFSLKYYTEEEQDQATADGEWLEFILSSIFTVKRKPGPVYSITTWNILCGSTIMCKIFLEKLKNQVKLEKTKKLWCSILLLADGNCTKTL